jgi:hypothetical protein
MNRTDMALKSLGVGVITAIFLLYVMFGVFLPAGGKLATDASLTVFSAVVFLADITGLVFGALGLRTSRPKLALAGTVLCAAFLVPLLVIIFYFFPGKALGT